jgi:hypothetical protein
MTEILRRFRVDIGRWTAALSIFRQNHGEAVLSVKERKLGKEMSPLQAGVDEFGRKNGPRTETACPMRRYV